MPVTSVEALELSELLGALLGAVVDAQAASARATVDFIESVGFEVVGTERQMRTVRMRYTKKDENGEFAEFEVDVPLLALVNVGTAVISKCMKALRKRTAASELPAVRRRMLTGV